MKRWLRLKLLQLMRAKGGPSVVAKGFAIGLAVEMFTLPTYGIAFFLIFPLAYFLQGSITAALIGFVLGKFIYLPLAYIHHLVGQWLVPEKFHQALVFFPPLIRRFLMANLTLLVGGMVNGTLLGVIVYFPLKRLLDMMERKRRAKKGKCRQDPSEEALFADNEKDSRNETSPG